MHEVIVTCNSITMTDSTYLQRACFRGKDPLRTAAPQVKRRPLPAEATGGLRLYLSG